LDEHTGNIEFTARLSLGVTQSKGAQDWVPTKDLYEFTGTIDQDAISGDLVRRLIEDAAGRSASEKIVLKREITKSSADKTSYDDWIRNWELRMKARGPKFPDPRSTVSDATAQAGSVPWTLVKIKDVPPVYPAAARATGVQGLVVIEATINEQGGVERPRVLRSIPLLDQAALDAVSQWRFKPILFNGAPLSIVVTLTVPFRLP
jgi:TonB family protein